MASWTGFLSAMLCIRSEPTTASFTDDMTAFQFNPAKSMWTLLIAAVVWTATNMISGIKASSGRDFPSFKSPTGGQRPPMRSDVFITCNVFAIASRFIYYAARPMSWAHAHHVHTMPPNVGYAALSTGIPSTNDNELKKCPAFMMLDMLIIVALSAIGYNHYWQPTFILAVIACAMRCIYYVRTRKSATYITGTSEYAQAWAAQVGNISRFFSLWYHHPLWLALKHSIGNCSVVRSMVSFHVLLHDVIVVPFRGLCPSLGISFNVVRNPGRTTGFSEREFLPLP